MYLKSFLKNWQLSLFVLLFLTSTDAFSQAGEKTSALNDAQIAHIAVTANQIDVDYGKLALEKSKDPEVRKFAETMIRDHEEIIKQATALATKLGVTPEDNEVSKSLRKQQTEMLKKLKKVNKSDFPALYINNEVDYHKAVIDAVKNVLIPNTQNAELKQTLEKVVPLLDHHLQMAINAKKKIK